MGGCDSNLAWKLPYPEGISKNGEFLFRHYDLQMCENGIFLVFAKYTLVFHVPALGHTTHHYVSWYE